MGELTGTCGENIFYRLDDEGNMWITGAGDGMESIISYIDEYEYVEDPTSIDLLRDRVVTVHISSGVTRISNLFSRCERLEKLVVSESVEKISIAWDAFKYSKSLKEVVLEKGIYEIKRDAFAGCENLTYIRIPDGTEKIGEGAFRGCTSLVDVYIPESVKEIGQNAFTDFRRIYCECWEWSEGWQDHWYGAEENVSRIIRGRDWDCFVVDEAGKWYFNQFAFLQELGDEMLGKRMVPNVNPSAKKIRDRLRACMEDETCDEDRILKVFEEYVSWIGSVFSEVPHGTEYLFEMWSLHLYVKQLASLHGMPESRRVFIRPMELAMKEYDEALEQLGGDVWIRCRQLIVGSQGDGGSGKQLDVEEKEQNARKETMEQYRRLQEREDISEED